MKLFIKIALTILFFIFLYLASEYNSFFVISLILLPIAAIILIVHKVKEFNKIKYKNINITPVADKPKNVKKE